MSGPANLEALGDCEAVITRLERQKARLPAQIAEAEAKAQEAREVLAAEREAIADLEKTRRTKEGEVQTAEIQREKFQGQTAVVKTNAEYHALLREIDGVNGRISTLEEDILVAMEEIETGGERLVGVEKEQAQIERIYVDQNEAHRKELEDVEAQLEMRMIERSQILEALGADVKRRYERVATVRGTGVARIRGDTCEACHYAVPPEITNRVTAGELHACGSCQRILVVSNADE